MADEEYNYEDDFAGEIGSEIDVIPDNDSFLPRYLTVQLLEILAATFGNSKPLEPELAKLAEEQAKFIEHFKNKDLFLPLTYSIFWRENPEQVLADNTINIDQTDKYNRAALTLAIANEDFALAIEILHKGATLMLEDKLVLEIDLISMIQRDAHTIDIILGAKPNDDLTWLADYLEYLNSYIVGEPVQKSLHYHDVLNPPIRHFGQVLDTLAYFNGLPSHYGFLSPSIEILTNHLQIYTEDMFDENIKSMFNIIANAYANTNNICEFYGNLPTTADCATKLAHKITGNIAAKNRDVVVLFGGWAGNSVSIAFIENYLIFSNLGIGGNPNAGTQIFNIKNPNGINEKMVTTFICGLGNATAPSAVLALLGNIVEPQPIYSIRQTFNPIDNCIFVNPRAVIQGILLILYAYAKDGKINADNLKQSDAQVAEIYGIYVDSLYKYSANDLANFMRNDEILQNKRIECCALAIDYINQHFREPAALERCIELKNALEFVGLGDFYISSVDPEAQSAIQQSMIHQQEAIAIKVIEQENALAAGQGQM